MDPIQIVLTDLGKILNWKVWGLASPEKSGGA